MRDRNVASSSATFPYLLAFSPPLPTPCGIDFCNEPRGSRGRDFRDEASSSARSFARPQRLVLSNPPSRGHRSRPALSELSSTRSGMRSKRSKPKQRSIRHNTVALLTTQCFLRPSLPGPSAFTGLPDHRSRTSSTPILALAEQPDFRSLPDDLRLRIIVPGSLLFARLAVPYNLLEPRSECPESTFESREKVTKTAFSTELY